MADPLAAIQSQAAQMEAAVAALADHPRAVICGGPRCGKTTVAARVAERYRRRLLPGDGLVGLLEWSDASAQVALWLDLPGDWVIEGVVAARALRKWMAAYPGERLPAAVLRLETPVHARGDALAAMAKGEATVWAGIADELLQVATVIAVPDSAGP
ncbi:MAG: hypothetical protein GWN84_20470 [Gammaproteobacteria bacterium]|nr:hypothetical protein [Gammaproteobacteria bacterium]NIR85136.1 hypothetical protein [Gammaproteobacteria bacterium]NIU06185.1 hypothetical protein [Gammaproteobacteria bacterium]NIX87458.1 hypothetical protein [Gammaproteobacteria bacterium]